MPSDKRNIEKTSNVDKVFGNHEPPLDVILQLCKKSIPENGKDPGYFSLRHKMVFSLDQ